MLKEQLCVESKHHILKAEFLNGGKYYLSVLLHITFAVAGKSQVNLLTHRYLGWPDMTPSF